MLKKKIRWEIFPTKYQGILIKLYDNVILHRDRQREQWNSIMSSYTDPHTYENLIHNRASTTSH